jgi:hypothetical protein
MTNSFHQIPIDDFSSILLSVSTSWGFFRPKFLPEGVGPASGIFQAIDRTDFADFEEWTIVIFDNFIVLATDSADIEVLRLVSRRSGCRENKQKIAPNISHIPMAGVRPHSLKPRTSPLPLPNPRPLPGATRSSRLCIVRSSKLPIMSRKQTKDIWSYLLFFFST